MRSDCGVLQSGHTCDRTGMSSAQATHRWMSARPHDAQTRGAPSRPVEQYGQVVIRESGKYTTKPFRICYTNLVVRLRPSSCLFVSVGLRRDVVLPGLYM